MRRRTARLCAAVLVLAGTTTGLAGCTADPAAPSGPARAVGTPTTSVKELEATVKEMLDSSVTQGLYPGAVILVRVGDTTVVQARGTANRHSGEQLTTEHRFRVGSITKSMVATVVLQLVAEGKLGLDDTVAEWLPRLLRNGDRITVRQLLSHQSGLFDFDDLPWLSTVGDRPVDHLLPVRRADRQPPVFAPGAGVDYSNTGYYVLGLIVEAVVQQTLAEEIEDRIFDPFGFESSSLEAALAFRAPLAHGYVGDRDVSKIPQRHWEWAAGGVVATAPAVARFYRELLDGRLVPPELLAEMKAPIVDNVEGFDHYGFGLAQHELPCGTTYGHSGRLPGYMAEAWTLEPGDRQVVVLVNTFDSARSGGFLEFAVEELLCG